MFRALSSDEIAAWWGSPELYRVTAWSGEVRPGGAWRSSGVGADGVAFTVGGEFLEVDPPRKLVHTWKADWDGGAPTTVTYKLEPIDGGTRVTLWHEGFAGRADSCAGHSDGWERVLGWLRKSFGAAEPRWFMCRLLPPRPSFMMDLNADELAVMKEHAAYWAGLLARDVAVLFGPVADPKGGWGVGIVRVAGEAELAALRDGDPAIRSGRGFQYEILPMLRATVRS